MEDFDIDSIIGTADPKEGLWNKFVDLSIDGNVIPVIGAEFIASTEKNVHQSIIKEIANYLHANDKVDSFSELIYDPEYQRFLHEKRLGNDLIYALVTLFVLKNQYQPSDFLRKLFETKRFPFVITTSFTPLVENVMREVWGDDVRVMSFNNDPHHIEDVLDRYDLRKPTVYYMFGRCGKNKSDYQRFALTDSDMLDFSSSWISENRCPKMLSSLLKEKYLLMLGNDYGDWLLRFIWYSIRKRTNDNRLDIHNAETMIVSSNIGTNLEKFIERLQFFYEDNPRLMVDEFVSRLKNRMTELERIRFNNPPKNADIFISYSRRDNAFVQKLYERLKYAGLDVWYDREDLLAGDQFMSQIYSAIGSSRFFMPVLSKNIQAETNDRRHHPYRDEWTEALRVANSKSKFIIPIMEDGIDLDAAEIPDEIKNVHASAYNLDDDIELIVSKIMKSINN